MIKVTASTIKKNIWTIAWSISVLFFAVPGVTHAEYIESFESDIVVGIDSAFVVTETIEYVFDSPRHGIFRTIPTTHPEAARHSYQERIIDISLQEITVDGNAVPYEVSEEADAITIKIGDPDLTIDGPHTYVISYKVTGGILYPQYGGAELYWNITGNDWDIPMRAASARISSPDPILRPERSCYRGTAGLTASCDRVVEEENGAVFFSTANLDPGHGLTIAQAVDRSKIARAELTRTKWIWIILPVGFIVLLYGLYRLYAYETKYKTGRTIIPEYEPFPSVKPMYMGALFDDSLDPQDITACIVYLAEQGFLKIRKTEKKVLFIFEVDDYEVLLTKPVEESVTQFEKKILELLFGETYQVGSIVSLSSLKNNLSVQQKNRVLLNALRSDLHSDLVNAGFFESRSLEKNGIFALIGILIPFAGLFIGVGGETLVPVFIGVIFMTVVVLIVINRRRTKKGYEALDHLLGFKMFLEMTERDRYAFHNVPQKSPDQFMEFLPYAIAFGVEKEWAKVFEGITIPNPGWYDGGSVSTFSATNLTTSIGAFSTALASSSGASPSSGGGSSGGGAGGGGGGSW